MDALILVGGEGTRLRPLTYDMPKPMLPIVERPIIARIVEWLARYGVERAILSLGYRPDTFLRAFPENAWEGVGLEYAVEPTPLDTAGAIRFAAHVANAEDQPLVIVNGDVLTDLDLDVLVKFHREHGGESTIALTPVEDPSAFGVVLTDEQGRVSAFVEKPALGTAPSNLINAGTYIFEPSVLRRIDPNRPVSVEKEVFPAMVQDGTLFAMASPAYWIDTGSPDRYVQCQLDILQGVRPQVIVPQSKETQPGIKVQRGVVQGGTWSGVAFAGENVVVHAGARVTDSVIGARCVIGAGASVERSVLLDGAELGEGVHCEDSIVGARARIGARATLRSLTVIGTEVEIEAGADLSSARIPS